VDHHCNFIHIVAARLFRPEDQPKLPADRRVDPYSDRYCGHPGDLEPPACHLVPCFDDQTGSVEAEDLFILPVRKAIWPPGRSAGQGFLKVEMRSVNREI